MDEIELFFVKQFIQIQKRDKKINTKTYILLTTVSIKRGIIPSSSRVLRGGGAGGGEFQPYRHKKDEIELNLF